MFDFQVKMSNFDSLENRIFDAILLCSNVNTGKLSIRNGNKEVFNLNKYLVLSQSSFLREIISSCVSLVMAEDVVIIAPEMDVKVLEDVEEVLEMEWKNKTQINLQLDAVESLKCLGLDFPMEKIEKVQQTDKIFTERKINSYFLPKAKEDEKFSSNPKVKVENSVSNSLEPKKKVTKTVSPITCKTLENLELEENCTSNPQNVQFKCIKCNYKTNSNNKTPSNINYLLRSHAITHFKDQFERERSSYFIGDECIFCGKVKWKNMHMLKKHEFMKEEVENFVAAVKESALISSSLVKKETNSTEEDFLPKIVSVSENYHSDLDDTISRNIQECLLQDQCLSSSDDDEEDEYDDDINGNSDENSLLTFHKQILADQSAMSISDFSEA